MSVDSNVIIRIESEALSVDSRIIILSKHLKIKQISVRETNNTHHSQNVNLYNQEYPANCRKVHVGRQKGEDIIAHWIRLYDASVSRNHCSISYQSDEMGPNSHQFLAFMQCCSDSLITNLSDKVILPKIIGRKILDYLYKPQGYIIKDNGSTFGTKFKLLQPHKIVNKEIFLLGDDIQMQIFEIVSSEKNTVAEYSKAKSKYSKRSFENHITNIETAKSILFLSIKVYSQYSVLHRLQDRQQPYFIGVNQEINIQGTANIDFYNPQSSIFYKNSSWWIQDGDGIACSPLGTYQKLQMNRNYDLKPGTELKLGLRTLMKFDVLTQ